MPKHPLLSQLQRYIHTIAFILLLSEVILLCSCCVKEGLVCIAITALSSCQPSFCSECTSANMQLSYNIYLVFDAECIYARLISL